MCLVLWGDTKLLATVLHIAGFKTICYFDDTYLKILKYAR